MKLGNTVHTESLDELVDVRNDGLHGLWKGLLHVSSGFGVDKPVLDVPSKVVVN